jgi:hypothetical protein
MISATYNVIDALALGNAHATACDALPAVTALDESAGLLRQTIPTATNQSYARETLNYVLGSLAAARRTVGDEAGAIAAEAAALDPLQAVVADPSTR